jgi:hypothetical protein
VGCGDEEATRDTAPPTTAPVETTAPPSLEQVDAMLLDERDIGSAWQLGPAVIDADLSDATQLPCPDTAINPNIAGRLTPITGVQFEPVDQSSKHLIEFAVTGQPEQLDADLQVLFDAMDACAATTPTTIGTGSLTVEQGGRVDIVDEAGGQVGYCELPDGRRIEEWEHVRSQTTITAP